MAARTAHLAYSDEAVKAGQLLFATAILNAKGEMYGSIMVFDFEDRAALDRWLEGEPYITGKVWQKVDIMPCKVGPSFVKK